MSKQIIVTTISEDNLIDSNTFIDNTNYAQRALVEIKKGDIVHHGAGQHGDNTIYRIIRKGKAINTGE